MDRTIEEILADYQANNPIGIYLYGSRLFNSQTDKSDWDFTIVVRDAIGIDGTNQDSYISLSRESSALMSTIDLEIVPQDAFLQLVQEHNPRILIHILSTTAPVFNLGSFHQEAKNSFVLDVEKLRSGFSGISNKAFACAKIQILKEKDFWKGAKNIIQSLRYLQFGIQILQEGRIYDLECANQYHNQMVQDMPLLLERVQQENLSAEQVWKLLCDRWKPVSLQLFKEFSSLLPPKQLTEARKARKSRKGKSKGQQLYQHLGEMSSTLPSSIIACIVPFLSLRDQLSCKSLNHHWYESVSLHHNKES